MPADPPIDTALLTKLGLRPGSVLGLLRAPEEWAQRFGKLAGASSAPTPARLRKADIILAWLEPPDDLEKVFAALERKIPPDGAVWAIIPKKGALAKGEQAVDWAAMQAAGLASGRLVDNKELRFDDRYYGTRFVVRKDQR